MTTGPRFRCFLSDEKTPVDSKSPVWSTPLPRRRNPDDISVADPDQYPITYGDYFSGVKTFLEKDGCRSVLAGIFRQTKSSVHAKDIRAIDIFLEKHGAFYHPARLEIDVGPCGNPLSSVLNVAVSDAGKKLASREYGLLRRLRNEHPWTYLPIVYTLDTVTVNNGKTDMVLFSGQWFPGYHEFHVSGFGPDGKADIRIWDGTDRSVLAPHLVGPLFRQAAMILTCYYDLYTSEQISAWHHAAGDFVVSVYGDRLDVKLITVRRYAPVSDDTLQDPESVIQSMLIFLLGLSLRMRLDRIDGTGRLVWIDDRAVAGTVTGFFDGLSHKAGPDRMAEPLAVFFKDYLASCSPEDLFDVAGAVVDVYQPEAPETSLVREHLQEHCAALHHIVTTRQ